MVQTAGGSVYLGSSCSLGRAAVSDAIPREQRHEKLGEQRNSMIVVAQFSAAESVGVISAQTQLPVELRVPRVGRR